LATVRQFIPSRLAISDFDTPSAANARTCAHSIALRTSSPSSSTTSSTMKADTDTTTPRQQCAVFDS